MSEDLRAKIKMLESQLGIKHREPQVQLEEWKKPNGSPIMVNMANPANIKAAKSLGWARKPGPKPQEQTTTEG